MSEERAEYVVAEREGGAGAAKLWPCPFCGAVPKIEPWGLNGARRAIECGNDECPAMPLVTAKSEAEVVSLWNTRVPSAPSAPPREKSGEKAPKFQVGDLVRVVASRLPENGLVGHVVEVIPQSVAGESEVYRVRTLASTRCYYANELRMEGEALWNTRVPTATSAPPREISPEDLHPGDLVRISKHSHHHSGCVGHVTDIDAMADGTMYLVRNKHGKCWCTRDELRKEVEA